MAKGHASDSSVVRLSRILERLTFGCAVGKHRHQRELSRHRGRSWRDVDRRTSSSSDPARPRGFDPVAPDPDLKRGRRYLVGYVGVMGIQEGIDLLLEAIRLIVTVHGRDDVVFALAGRWSRGQKAQSKE